MRGLLGRPALRESEAMVISPCNMVHTIGMSYPIDVVFADRHGVVLRISPRVVPSRMRMCLRAKYVVEMKAGEAARRSWTRGTRLAFLVASKEAS
jgi:uncharacterized membrane protein (UPF0127 family)